MSVDDANEMFCRTLGHIRRDGEWTVASYDFWNPGGREYEWYTREQRGTWCLRCNETLVESESEPRYTGRQVGEIGLPPVVDTDTAEATKSWIRRMRESGATRWLPFR